jgi:CheY-like chemotaxis protein
VQLEILIVEDHNSLRQMMAEHLRGCGYVVQEADSCLELTKNLLTSVPHIA